MKSNTYSVKAASRLSGVGPSTLRAWERRHAAISPGRDASGRRFYTPEDVTRLTLLNRATGMGQPIGAVAGLGTSELRALCDQDRTPLSDSAAREILAAVESYDDAACERVISRAMAGLDPVDLAGEVLGPVLREVGRRWATGEMSIAQERMLSATVERLLQSGVNLCRWGTAGPGILFATLSGEQHALGTLMATLIAVSRGYKTRYLGPNLPADEVVRSAQSMDCGIVAVGMTRDEHPHARLAELSELCQAFPGQVWLGGSAAQAFRAASIPGNCTLISSESQYLDQLRMAGTRI